MTVFTNHGPPFVLKSALERYLTKDRIKRLLEDCQMSPRSFDSELQGYLCIFVILLLIGKGEMIPIFFQDSAFSDSRLPFDADSLSFVSPDIFPAFDKYQWKFCPLVFDSKNLRGGVLDERTILPFKTKLPLHQGTSDDSSTYRVEIYQEYNQLQKVRAIQSTYAEAVLILPEYTYRG